MRKLIKEAINEEYQGWKNYETWTVKLWIDNDQGLYQYWEERAQEHASAGSTSEYWSAEESAQFNLADELKEYFAEANPLAEEANLWSDLMSAALSEVDWQEVAESLLEEKEYPGNEDEQAEQDVERKDEADYEGRE